MSVTTLRYNRAMLKIWGGLVVLLFVPVVAEAAEPAASPRNNTIEVVTQASVAVTPDRALLDLGVTTDKKTATAAIAENDRKMEQVIAALKKEVGAGGEVKTSDLNVTPRFGESKRGEVSRPILGYTVTNIVHVQMADTKAVGRLLDGNRYRGLCTDSSSDRATLEYALIDAVTDALDRRFLLP